MQVKKRVEQVCDSLHQLVDQAKNTLLSKLNAYPSAPVHTEIDEIVMKLREKLSGIGEKSKLHKI